jgi:hypothetical protein
LVTFGCAVENEGANGAVEFDSETEDELISLVAVIDVIFQTRYD